MFDLLRDQLHMIFFLVPAMIQGKVSLDRVSDFLNATELLDEFKIPEKENSDAIESFSVSPSDPEVIGFRDATYVWSEDDGTLTPSRRKFRLNIEGELSFKRGSLNMIIGPTGSGKTSLLMALLGE